MMSDFVTAGAKIPNVRVIMELSLVLDCGVIQCNECKEKTRKILF